ncbi:MAG: discoidin domain-containing protein, partial [Planctomycetota bacterium]
TFNTVRISEEYDRIRRFELQVRNDGEWKTIHKGTTVGREFALTVEPVKARHVRLNILEAIHVPTIWEMELFDE